MIQSVLNRGTKEKEREGERGKERRKREKEKKGERKRRSVAPKSETLNPHNFFTYRPISEKFEIWGFLM